MSVIFMNPLHPEDAGELWPQLLKDRKQLKKRKAEKNAAVISGTICFTLELLCAFFGYVYLFFEDRLLEFFEKLPMVKKFFDLICNHILSRGEMKWYFSLALTVGLLFVLPAAVSLVFKLLTALVYHPKATEPCPEGSDEQIAEKLFRFADDSFELNAKLNDRGKTPKIVSMVATAIMAGLSIYGFVAVTGAQIKVSIPLLIVGLILLVVSLFFVVYGLETLMSLLIKLFYYRSNKNIYDFRTAAEKMYNDLRPAAEEENDISEQTNGARDLDIIDKGGATYAVESSATAEETDTYGAIDTADTTEGTDTNNTTDVTDTVGSSDTFAAENNTDETDSVKASVSADDLPLEGFSVVSEHAAETDHSSDEADSSDNTAISDEPTATSNDARNAAQPSVSDPALSTDSATTETVDTGNTETNDTATDTATDTTITDTAVTDTAVNSPAASDGAVADSADATSTVAGATATGAAASAAVASSVISKAAARVNEGSLSKTELKKYSPSLWTPLYVAENEQQCASVVSEYNKTAIDSLKQHSFNDGQEGLKNAAKCLLKMAEYDAEKYEPQLYITLYAIGKVSAFGQNDREQAKASLAACKRIAEKCARPERKGAPRVEKELVVIRRIMADFESDMTMDELREKYGKNFPADLCGNN